MQTPDMTNTAERPRGGKGNCCCDEDGCEAGLRNNYFQGKLLTADTLRVEQRYLLERRRLLNRAIHGWGVVYGYATEASSRNTLCIETGLALDACGREVLEVGSKRLGLDQLLILDKKGRPAVDEDGKRLTFQAAFVANQHVCWLLQAHYAELSTDHVTVTDNCRCPHDEWDHTCETVRYTLTMIPCGDCCLPDECGLACDCCSSPCCEPASEGSRREPEEPLRRPRPPGRGGCACLCEHLTHLHPGEGCHCPLTPFDDPCAEGRLAVDLGHGVPLACLKVAFDRECADWTIARVDGCGPRRLVKRNDLLFDLIRGCDLTRISAIGWWKWHRQEEPVSYVSFREAFGAVGQRQPAYVTETFWIRFSRPVRRSTLLPDCFAMTVFSTEREGGWWQGSRVPIVGLEYLEADDKREGLVIGARLIVDGAWADDALGPRNIFRGETTLVEIEIRGDFIVDCNGQTVDANAIGLETNRMGNGVPGGTFRSGFRVGPALEKRVPSFPGKTIEGEQS